MPLERLVSTIETLQERIGTQRPNLQTNETRTRMALIDPLLSALGWDTSDPGLVCPEYDVSGKRADYGLLGSDGNPIVFLEAKRLGEPLSNHRSQIVAYASELGIKYPALTDGDAWEVYDNSKLVPIEQRRILELTLTGAAAHKCALQLLLLWRPNLSTAQPIPANAPIVGLAPPTAADLRPDPTPPVSPSTDGWTSLVDLRPGTGKNAPSTIRLPDREERQIKNWSHVLLEVAAWLSRTGRLTRDMCPLRLGKIRYIVHTEARHSNGKEFVVLRQLPNGMFLEANYSANDSAENARFLLTRCNQAPAEVLLKFD